MKKEKKKHSKTGSQKRREKLQKNGVCEWGAFFF